MPSIEFEDLRYEMLEGESVLETLIRGGADINFSCRKGACQVCMMRLVDGDLDSRATRLLRDGLVQGGHFLPCCAHPTQDIVIDRADLTQVSFQAVVSAREQLSASVVGLLLEPEINLAWIPGQYVSLLREDGVSRNYSIASVGEEDYFLTLHVKRVEGGQVSSWIHDELKVGDFVTLQGPMGECIYRPGDKDQPLMLVGTGTGIAPLIGILRDALRHDHQEQILIYHGVTTCDELYLDAELMRLTAAHPNVEYHPCVSDASQDGPWFAGLVTEAAFGEGFDGASHVVYLCGNPDMVYEGRHRAICAGVRRANILADPFESAQPYWPQDNEKLGTIDADPELWDALEQGRKLRVILQEFYDEVYEDPRLAPFFHNSTKERAISKQYEFLDSVFDGRHTFFGLLPFNAHRWMIISDELFDYREELFETHLRRHEIQEHLIRRWMGFQELFRREIVKSKERGMISAGVETLKTGYTREILAIGSMCDGCHQEMPPQSEGSMHQRTGQFFCLQCSPGSARA